MLAVETSGRRLEQNTGRPRPERRDREMGDIGRSQRRVLVLNERGEAIGSVDAPVNDEVVGYGRGSVYLARPH